MRRHVQQLHSGRNHTPTRFDLNHNWINIVLALNYLRIAGFQLTLTANALQTEHVAVPNLIFSTKPMLKYFVFQLHCSKTRQKINDEIISHCINLYVEITKFSFCVSGSL